MSLPTIALRRYGKTAAMAAASTVGESRLFLFDYLLRVLRVGVLLALWRIILPHRGTVSGMTLGAVLTYTLVAEVFAEQLTSYTRINIDLWDGSIAVRLVQPIGMVQHYAADMVGRWLVGLALFSLPLLVIAPLLGVNPLPAGPAAALLFVPSLGLAIAVGLALELFFAGLIFVLNQPVWVIGRMQVAATALLSGSLLPLALLPWGIGGVFSWLPFASMASAPLQIYAGTGDAALLLLVQAVWAAALWPLSLWLWRANRERLVAYGG
jgi:ABC-2 type transport system permease protein